MRFASWNNIAGFVVGGYALLSGVASANEPVPVTVAAYEFPPYYSSHLERHLLGELLAALNERQDEFEFEVIEVRPPHRYQALASAGCCELIFFEAVKWGWQPYLLDNDPSATSAEHAGRSVVKGPQLTRGADFQMVHATETETQADSSGTSHGSTPPNALSQKIEQDNGPPRIGGIVGYHYEFVGFQNDVELLENEHNLYLADNHITLLNMLRRGRLDRILLNQELFSVLKTQSPDLARGLEASGIVDQQYVTHVLISAHGQISAVWLRQQLDAMYASGELQTLFQSFGLDDFLAYQQ